MRRGRQGLPVALLATLSGGRLGAVFGDKVHNGSTPCPINLSNLSISSGSTISPLNSIIKSAVEPCRFCRGSEFELAVMVEASETENRRIKSS